MRRMNVLAVSALALCATQANITEARADDMKQLASSGNWSAYAYTEGGAKVCYAAAQSDKQQGGEKNRAPTAMAITHRAKSPNEVSLLGKYGFKKDSDAEIQIGGMKHSFFTRGNAAWAKDAKADPAIIAALAKGKEVIVHVTPAKGAAISDTISLKGFADALAAIDKACGVKR